jgi:hypothetical protein
MITVLLACNTLLRSCDSCEPVAPSASLCLCVIQAFRQLHASQLIQDTPLVLASCCIRLGAPVIILLSDNGGIDRISSWSFFYLMY